MTLAPRRKTKTISDHKSCSKLAAMVETGHARIVKEIVNGNPGYLIFGKSGVLIGIAGKKWEYIFKELLEKCGAGDGLFPGCDQTTEWRK